MGVHPWSTWNSILSWVFILSDPQILNWFNFAEVTIDASKQLDVACQPGQVFKLPVDLLLIISYVFVWEFVSVYFVNWCLSYIVKGHVTTVLSLRDTHLWLNLLVTYHFIFMFYFFRSDQICLQGGSVCNKILYLRFHVCKRDI